MKTTKTWIHQPNPPDIPRIIIIRKSSKSWILNRKSTRTKSVSWTQYFVSRMFLGSLGHLGVGMGYILCRRRFFRKETAVEICENQVRSSIYKGVQHNISKCGIRKSSKSWILNRKIDSDEIHFLDPIFRFPHVFG